ncbi:S66 peptidase family protein [Arthrobacter alpinus]|uniref:S66 family peptidase n=1 Tax=Arthrobacter alpinus TaxID=656366 RepID=UPI0016481BF5|nr:S66 peptidase family protein [Arthrobacter alpinus]
MEIRYPKPLVPGDIIGITAPSSGVPESLAGRLDFAVKQLHDRGFVVDMGDCMDGSTHVSGPVEQRAGEFMRMLLDPKIRAIVPPWGGVTAIDLIPHLDFDAIASAEPTWLVGYSDISTLLTPITLLTGMATLHGSNLLDTPYRVPESLMSWIDIASLPTGASFRQASPRVYRVNDWDDWENKPEIAEQTWNGSGAWERLDNGQDDVSVTGRLFGGCIETMVNLAGSPYLSTKALRNDPSASVIAYVEASSVDATTICRHLHGMRLSGFFDGAKAILVGRTGAPDSPTLTQTEAVLDALGMLGIPIIGNVECGHVPPQLPIINGAEGHLVFNEKDQYLDQKLV